MNTQIILERVKYIDDMFYSIDNLVENLDYYDKIFIKQIANEVHDLKRDLQEVVDTFCILYDKQEQCLITSRHERDIKL